MYIHSARKYISLSTTFSVTGTCSWSRRTGEPTRKGQIGWWWDMALFENGGVVVCCVLCIYIYIHIIYIYMYTCIDAYFCLKNSWCTGLPSCLHHLWGWGWWSRPWRRDWPQLLWGADGCTRSCTFLVGGDWNMNIVFPYIGNKNQSYIRNS